MMRILWFNILMLSVGSLVGQEPGLPPRSDVPQTRDYPLVQLSYYMGVEGKTWQEYVELELDEWTPQKDVIISSRLIRISGIPVPGARAPGTPRDKTQSRYPVYRVRREWIVEYAEAATEGESHLFINAAGLPRVTRDILYKDELFGFAHIPGRGWYETRVPAKAYHHWLRHRNDPKPPSDTQPSPSDTQNAPDTRSR